MSTAESHVPQFRVVSMGDVHAPIDDSTAQRQRVLAFFNSTWPPENAQMLYDWGWSKMPQLGKDVCLRVALASYEAQGRRLNETEYDRSARKAAELWVLKQDEETRKMAGRIASVQLPQPSIARVIANMAGSKNRWPTAVGYALLGNPHAVSSETFRTIRDAVAIELQAWARGERDAVAERYRDDVVDA